MKKTIPFKKELAFENSILEIKSISLEHAIKDLNNQNITGEFYLNGEYLVLNDDALPFNFTIPFDIDLDNKYETRNIEIDIVDFYYEVEGSNTLNINIELGLDKLIEKEIIDNEIFDEVPMREEIFSPENQFDKTSVVLEKKRCIEPEDCEIEEKQIKEYATYKVYQCEENDTLDKIMNKYKVSYENLEKYNVICDIKKGDKYIIPSND